MIWRRRERGISNCCLCVLLAHRRIRGVLTHSYVCQLHNKNHPAGEIGNNHDQYRLPIISSIVNDEPKPPLCLRRHASPDAHLTCERLYCRRGEENYLRLFADSPEVTTWKPDRAINRIRKLVPDMPRNPAALNTAGIGMGSARLKRIEPAAMLPARPAVPGHG